jgi:hypothetical protein
MKKLFSFFLNFLLFAVPAFGQSQLQWVKRYSLVSSATNQATAIALAPDGSVIVAGTSASTNGDLDYVAVKYTPSGQQLWLTRYDSPAHGQDRHSRNGTGQCWQHDINRHLDDDSTGNKWRALMERPVWRQGRCHGYEWKLVRYGILRIGLRDGKVGSEWI